jgi:hypothetical protein
MIIEKAFLNATLENGQEASTNVFPFLKVGTKIQDLVAETKITNSFTRIEVRKSRASIEIPSSKENIKNQKLVESTEILT